MVTISLMVICVSVLRKSTQIKPTNITENECVKHVIVNEIKIHAKVRVST